MPELPEVETIARNLRPALLGQTITHVDVFWPKTLATHTPETFDSRLSGQEVRAVSRRGKYLILQMQTDTLLVHLRMSGDMNVFEAAYRPAKHDRILWHLLDGRVLAFNDTRKFGRVWLTDAPQRLLDRLGPEPFDPTLTPARFYAALQGRKRQIKALLLDQAFLAGLGNIYSDEALYRARLHPLKRSDTISPLQAEHLLAAIRQVLEAGIQHNGTSIDWVYRGGKFQDYLQVYGRAGKPCKTCGTPVQKIRVAQRGTHFCPHCQKE